MVSVSRHSFEASPAPPRRCSTIGQPPAAPVRRAPGGADGAARDAGVRWGVRSDGP